MVFSLLWVMQDFVHQQYPWTSKQAQSIQKVRMFELLKASLLPIRLGSKVFGIGVLGLGVFREVFVVFLHICTFNLFFDMVATGEMAGEERPSGRFARLLECLCFPYVRGVRIRPRNMEAPAGGGG